MCVSINFDVNLMVRVCVCDIKDRRHIKCRLIYFDYERQKLAFEEIIIYFLCGFHVVYVTIWFIQRPHAQNHIFDHFSFLNASYMYKFVCDRFMLCFYISRSFFEEFFNN